MDAETIFVLTRLAIVEAKLDWLRERHHLKDHDADFFREEAEAWIQQQTSVYIKVFREGLEEMKQRQMQGLPPSPPPPNDVAGG